MKFWLKYESKLLSLHTTEASRLALTLSVDNTMVNSDFLQQEIEGFTDVRSKMLSDMR